jgi:DNA modification methylase
MSLRIDPKWADDRPGVQIAYKTNLGNAYQASIDEFLSSPQAKRLRGKVQLVFTSPPFPLSSPKKYGNFSGSTYVEWLSDLTQRLAELLTDDGSLVVEIGNAWDKKQPTMSTIPLETLIAIKNKADLNVCQQFVCTNPNRLPSPINYVNVERSRVKDAFTHIWWYSRAVRPYADQWSILVPYSNAMRKLLDRQSYNAGLRPSDHTIGDKSFLKDNGGAIPPNDLSFLLQADFDNRLEFTGSPVDRGYRDWCREHGIRQHPAKMSHYLAEFFIKFLSREGDRVLDPFGGSNTTGAVAERLGRRWTIVEMNGDYLRGSIGRFTGI